jgi:acetyltransferase-like isoleucine patch superfamily enzyme
MAILDFWRRRASRKALRKLPALLRNSTRLQRQHPRHQFGIGTYGDLQVHDWDEGTTLRVGSYCSIAKGVQVFLGGHHRIDWLSSFPFPAFVDEVADIPDYGGSNGDVTIGSDVWLCTDAIILSGVTIGHGAVVAAGAVVTRDVEPYSIVAGNPARHIRWRFEEPTRKLLLSSQWWTWPEAEVRLAAKLLCSSDAEAFRAYLAARGPVAVTSAQCARDRLSCHDTPKRSLTQPKRGLKP